MSSKGVRAKRSSANPAPKNEVSTVRKQSNVSALNWFYLVLGLVLLLWPVLLPNMWRGSDENFVSFPFTFGLIFLIFYYVLGKNKNAVRWGILASIVILLLTAIILAGILDVFTADALYGPPSPIQIITGILFMTVWASMVNFAFLFTWVPYVFGLIFLTRSFLGKDNKEAVKWAVWISVALLVLIALGFFAIMRFS